MNTVEGSLDIFWENNAQPTASPRYKLIFARYHRLEGGAMPSKSIVGAEALESYLTEIGFASKDAKRWIQQLREGTVSIPNVMMPVNQMPPYERQSA
jgi:hypothetical protein